MYVVENVLISFTCNQNTSYAHKHIYLWPRIHRFIKIINLRWSLRWVRNKFSGALLCISEQNPYWWSNTHSSFIAAAQDNVDSGRWLPWKFKACDCVCDAYIIQANPAVSTPQVWFISSQNVYVCVDAVCGHPSRVFVEEWSLIQILSCSLRWCVAVRPYMNKWKPFAIDFRIH